jgi:hypothetical protein
MNLGAIGGLVSLAQQNLPHETDKPARAEK